MPRAAVLKHFGFPFGKPNTSWYVAQVLEPCGQKLCSTCSCKGAEVVQRLFLRPRNKHFGSGFKSFSTSCCYYASQWSSI